MDDLTGSIKKITRARTALVLAHPFFASLVLRLRLVDDDSCETAWTDGQVLAYNPDYIDELPLDELTGLCAHIVMHPVCGHHQRRNGRDALLWNRACDYAINWILIDAGITLPRGFLHNSRYRNKNADEIYVALKSHQSRFERNDLTTQMSGSEGVGVGSGSGEQNQESETDEVTLSSEENPDSDQDLEHKKVDEAPSGGDPGKAGEVRDAQTQQQAGEDSKPDDDIDWQMALAQSANQARSIGKLPAGIERLVDELLEPKLDWQDILLRFIDQSARNDYSWTPPNRRHLHDGLYLPSMQNKTLSEMVIVADTSGSISQSDFDFLAVELSSILEVNAVHINLLYCDVKVVDSCSLTREDLPLEIEAKGGGGTDFRPAFEWVEDEDINPACLIYLSDMECDKFPQEPDYPVLWGRIGDAGTTPPFGELLDISLSENNQV